MNRFLARAPSIQPAVKEMTSEELDAKVAEFLRNGGDVKAIPIGASAYGHGAAVDLDVAISGDRGGYNPLNAQMKQAENDRRIKATRQRNRRPIKKSAIDGFEKILEEGSTLSKAQVAARLSVSTGTVNRIVLEHFQGDSRAARYRPGYVTEVFEEAEQKLLKRVRAMIASDTYDGREDMARKLNVDPERLRRLQEKFGLQIKRGKRAPKVRVG